MRALDKATGQTVELPDDVAVQRYFAGEVQLEAGAEVPVRDTDGSLGMVAVDKLPSALQGGYALASRQEVNEKVAQDQYGDVAGQGVAALAGAARGVSMGLSDEAAVAVGGERTRQYLAGVKEANPVSSIGGEVGGIAAATLLTRGKGAETSGGGVMRAITAGPRGAARLGTAAEELTTAILPRAETALGRIATRAVSSGVGAAAESLPYAIGHQISEEALGDKDRTANEIAAAIGFEVLAGGGAGAILGGAGAAIREGVAGAGKVSASAAEALASRMTAGDTTEAAGLKLRALNYFTGQNATTVNEALEGFARARALKATGALSKQHDEFTRLVQRNPEAAKRASTMILEDMPAILGKRMDDAGAGLSRTEMAQAVDLLEKRALKALDDAIAPIDDAAAAARKARKPMAGVAYDIDSATLRIRKIADDLRATPGAESVADAIESYSKEFYTKARGKPLSVVRGFRRVIDNEKINWKAGTKLSNDAWKEVRHVVEAEIESTVERAAERLGKPDLLKLYRQDFKRDWQALSWLEEATARGLKGEATNRTIGFSEQVMGGAASVAGAVVGGSIGSLPGLAIGGAAGLGMGVLSRVIKDRGDAIVANAAYQLAKGNLPQLANLARISEVTRTKTAREVGGFVRELVGESASRTKRIAERGAQRAAGERRQDVNTRFERAQSLVTPWRTNPAVATERLGRSIDPISKAAPGVAAALVQHNQRTAGYLADRMPRPTADATLTPNLQSQDVPRYQKVAWLRMVDAANDPIGAVRDGLRNRTLDKATVDVVRDLYPPVYEQIRMAAFEQLANAKRPVPYADRITVGLLLDLPADPSMEPRAIAMMQQSYQSERGDETESRPRPREVQSAKTAGDAMTPAQRAET